MFSSVFADLGWSDDCHVPASTPRPNPLTIVRRPASTRANLPAPRPDGQVLRRWRGRLIPAVG